MIPPDTDNWSGTQVDRESGLGLLCRRVAARPGGMMSGALVQRAAPFGAMGS